jgi:polyhydroxybutyrate depolymerase
MPQPEGIVAPVTIQVNGVDRNFLVYVSKNYNSKVKAPVTITFSGLGSNAEEVAGLFSATQVAEDHGAIAIAPEPMTVEKPDGTQSQTIWLVERDLDFVRAMIDYVDTHLSIDRKRVYALGHSDGAYFASQIPKAAPGLVAGVFTYAGLSPNTVDATLPSPPILISVGTDDEVVGDESITSLKNALVTRLRCEKSPETKPITCDPAVPDAPVGTSELYSQCDNGASVLFMLIPGRSHKSFPSSESRGNVPPRPGCETYNQLNSDMWNFLTGHPNPHL